MGILSGAFERRGKSLGDQALDWIGGPASSSGVSVSHGKALTISAVFACIRVLSETLASLPLHLYERRPDGGKRRAVDHPLYAVLHDIANPEMTSYKLRETLQAHVVSWGNGYAEIEIGNAGEVVALWPLRPDKTEPVRINGVLYYRTERAESMGGGPLYLSAERVFHVHGLGSNGLQGYSVIRTFREGLGLTLAAERYGAKFFGNGARPGLALSHPGQLGDEALKNLRETWTETHGGLDNANRVAILEEGMKIETIGLPPDEAQFLGTRKFQVNEIARIYRVPPHMIADLERATFSNIEHLSIDFMRFTMTPWLENWDQEIKRQLLLPKERARYYAEFLAEGVLRGDTESRYNAYHTGRQGGWLSANDVRKLENMDPIEGGDQYLIPLNMVPAAEPGSGAPADAGEDGDRGLVLGESRERRKAGLTRHRLIGTWRPLYAEAAGRTVRRETNDILNRARQFAKADAASGRLAGGVGEFLLWLDTFYREYAGVVAGNMRPVSWSYAETIAADVDAELGSAFRSLGGAQTAALEAREDGAGSGESGEPWAAFAQRYTEAAASRHVAKSKDRISDVVRRAIADGEPWIEALAAEFDQQREARPGQIADREAVRFNSALAVSLYTVAGVRRIRWVAIGESCPYCTALNGKVIAIESSFLDAGAFRPEGIDKPLTVKRRVGHAPAHGGCDCLTMAAL